MLLLGAGEMSELTAKYLVDAGVRDFFIANRTLEKAQALASRLGGKALSLSDGLSRIAEVDILLTSLGGGSLPLTRSDLEGTMKNRKGRSLFIIDTGVPRNVEPEAGRIESVYLYNIDDLSAVAEANRENDKKRLRSRRGSSRRKWTNYVPGFPRGNWCPQLSVFGSLSRKSARRN